jgi:hypothetical protein
MPRRIRSHRRPGVVLFDEALPEATLRAAQSRGNGMTRREWLAALALLGAGGLSCRRSGQRAKAVATSPAWDGSPSRAEPPAGGGTADYMTTAFLFLKEPSFATVADGFPALSLRGYRNKSRPLWLMDLWFNRGKHFPFQDRLAVSGAPALGEPGPADPPFVRELEALTSALGDGIDRAVSKECRLILSVSRRTGTPTFFFAGNDNLVDVAGAANGIRLERYRCRLDRLTVIHERGRSQIVPAEPLDADERKDQKALLATVRRAVTWPVAPNRPFDGSYRLHDNALAMWPKEAGRPGEPLGVGSWDPLEHLARDFEVVFER